MHLHYVLLDVVGDALYVSSIYLLMYRTRTQACSNGPECESCAATPSATNDAQAPHQRRRKGKCVQIDVDLVLVVRNAWRNDGFEDKRPRAGPQRVTLRNAALYVSEAA